MSDKFTVFQNLHIPGKPFVMANAWNGGSAVLLEEAGFAAIATTSAGIAFGRALPDYEGALSFNEALLETRRIAGVVQVPVSMDAENGYGHAPEEVSKNMQEIVATGVAGAGIEDYSGNDTTGIYDLDLAVERIAAAKTAVEALDYPFTLTARSECYLYGHANPFSESVERVNRYREAGADCLFVPGIGDIKTIELLVREVDGPVSVVMGLSGVPVTVAQLADAGVARISIGGSLARATFGLVRQAAAEMLEKGSFDYASIQIADSELCELFSKNR